MAGQIQQGIGNLLGQREAADLQDPLGPEDIQHGREMSEIRQLRGAGIKLSLDRCLIEITLRLETAGHRDLGQIGPEIGQIHAKDLQPTIPSRLPERVLDPDIQIRLRRAAQTVSDLQGCQITRELRRALQGDRGGLRHLPVEVQIQRVVAAQLDPTEGARGQPRGRHHYLQTRDLERAAPQARGQSRVLDHEEGLALAVLEQTQPLDLRLVQLDAKRQGNVGQDERCGLFGTRRQHQIQVMDPQHLNR